MSSASYYFLKAKECGRLAYEATDPTLKESLLEEQKQWLAIADSMCRDGTHTALEAGEPCVGLANRKD